MTMKSGSSICPSYLLVSSTNHSHSRDGDDCLHVLVVGHAGLAVRPVLEVRFHDGAHGEEGGRRGDAGIGIKAFLLVIIHNMRQL